MVNFSYLKKIDLHIHTTFSDGACSIEQIMSLPVVKNLQIIAITDHYCEFLFLTNRMTKHSLSKYLPILENFNLLKGIEVDILDDGLVAISRASLFMFDVVIGGLHSVCGINLWNDFTSILNPSKYMETLRVALIKAMESKKLDIIAHITRLPETLHSEHSKLFTDDWIESVVKSASDNNVAIELSGAWKIPDERFITKCLNYGVKMSLGSDAHTCKMIGKTGYGVEMWKRLDICKDCLFLPKTTD
ncbi:MAG: PHP domain-containing protein [Candidatus Bathyarchaeota archaeon]